jgi:ribonuclease HI
MKKYLTKVKEAMGSFDKISFTKVPREENSQADTLARIGFAIKEDTTTGRLVQEVIKSLIV